MNTFFTGCTHFHHANIIKYCNRPFASSLEMNNTIISNWNKVVGEHDLVYHLGDFCFGREEREIEAVLRQLKGKIILIKGNHDRLAWKYRHKFYAAYDSYLEIELNEQAITLCHYPMFRWNKSHHYSWMLHSHVHGNLKTSLPEAKPSIMGLILDIGVDVNNFTPVSYEQVKIIMDNKRSYIEESKVFAGRHHEGI